MHWIALVIGLVSIILLAMLAIANIKHCRAPHRKPRIWKDAAVLLLLSGMVSATAAQPPVALDLAPYAAGQWALTPFASYRVHEFASSDGKFGGGLALSYMLQDNAALELETISEGIDDSKWSEALVEAGANFKVYLPIRNSGFAPYGLLGYTRNLQEDENRMNAGAGLEWRASRRFSLFADGRWTQNFETLGHALFRGGLSLRF